MDDRRLLLPELERRLLNPEVRRNPHAVAALLGEGFREFGASGKIWTREAILAELASEPPLSIQASDFLVTMLSPEIALVTYHSSRMESGQPTRQALRSSLWQLQDDCWRVIFHQGTLIP